MKPDLHHGDCREVLRGLTDESIHACVTDPPYELTSGGNRGFMGKEWDGTGVAFDVAMWREVLRVLKPGGHLLAFGGTRTYHRMACAIEDAGFEIRDCIAWHYGQGFPKSLDVSKAIDKAAGAERTDGFIKAVAPSGGIGLGMNARCARCEKWKLSQDPCRCGSGKPATPAAREWSGWGTALKPATEPIVVARKPLVGTVVANVLEHGTGAINVEGCRVGTTKRVPGSPKRADASEHTVSLPGYDGGSGHDPNVGRWPPNLLLTHAYDCADTCAPDCPVRLMDAQSGELKAGVAVNRNRRPGTMSSWMGTRQSQTGKDVGFGDSGGASRFFPTFRHEIADAPFLYQAKASKADRGEGNGHPTVKPLALMRWLVRLVTPKGGVVLDPFAGSGTTLLAARADGFASVGIEREADHIAIIRARLALDPVEGTDTSDDQQPQRRQLALFG